ncbi:serine hydrolase [Neolewinella aurantiaca]|uniref:Serine hydrolase n=1 Tax=Neolewinella aurantiaca TaxID=2602767 RepID=A0A5C7FWE6_9BACT|nr:serine hydrolase [Neolewinella aurantiaca]TXF90722.1 serine hydrolase [Neolewinella aurantiaca]
MKTLSFSLFICLSLFSTPVHAASWTDELFEWFASFFRDDAAEPTRHLLSTQQLDSLRASPTGLLLNEIADADTLTINTSWPYESVDPAGDLERHGRLLRQTVLLTSPVGKLPLEDVPAVRVIYRQDQRPARFIGMARRFADVQEVPFDDVIGYALPVGLDLPTIIVADDPKGQSAFNSDWYHALYELEGDGITLIHFGDANVVTGVPQNWSVLNTPLRCKESEAFLGQAIFGAELIDGRLAQTTPAFRAGTGYRLEPVRKGFRLPEELGIDRRKMDYVDYQINRGIRYRAMPGAQLLVLKDGQVVYEKAYGHHTYRKQPVNPGDLYDLASVTKAAATTLAVMKLYDDGRIALDAEVRDYLPELKKKVIGRYKIERLLAHHTGLQSEIPLTGLIGKQFVAEEMQDAFKLPVGPGRWLSADVPGMIRKNLTGKIGRTRRQVYKYSDLNYYLLQLVVEQIAGEPMNELLEREFYQPMGLGRLGFRPAETFPADQLVPTVSDPWMRGGLLRGYVHDEGAALLGGVAGHAGLFANAHDLGRLFQLFIDEGAVGNQQLLSPETVSLFTTKNRFNYRALGFDRLTGGWQNVINAGASPETFGHLGFSGTSVWADPENDLVFVLLTNRVHPDPKNERFQQMQIRGKVHKGVYQALNSWEPAL